MKTKLLLAVGILALLGLGYVAFAGEADPFAGAGSGGDQSGLAAPDGSSSIRAKKRPSADQFEGVIENINKDEANFPNIINVKIKITKAPTNAKAPNDELKKGATVLMVVDFAKDGDKINLKDPNNQVNLGIWYLEKGDTVQGVVKEKKGSAFLLDYLQRK